MPGYSPGRSDQEIRIRCSNGITLIANTVKGKNWVKFSTGFHLNVPGKGQDEGEYEW